MKERKDIVTSLTLVIDALIESTVAMQYATTPEGRALYARNLRALNAIDALPRTLKEDWEHVRKYEAEWGEAA